MIKFLKNRNNPKSSRMKWTTHCWRNVWKCQRSQEKLYGAGLYYKFCIKLAHKDSSVCEKASYETNKVSGISKLYWIIIKKKECWSKMSLYSIDLIQLKNISLNKNNRYLKFPHLDNTCVIKIPDFSNKW